MTGISYTFNNGGEFCDNQNKDTNGNLCTDFGCYKEGSTLQYPMSDSGESCMVYCADPENYSLNYDTNSPNYGKCIRHSNDAGGGGGGSGAGGAGGTCQLKAGATQGDMGPCSGYMTSSNCNNIDYCNWEVV